MAEAPNAFNDVVLRFIAEVDALEPAIDGTIAADTQQQASA